MKYKFPENFWWGAAASGIQTEGNTNKVNDSIWDLWYKKEPERFFEKISSSKVCDTYNRFREDVKLMKDINFNSFRTSIQWSRLIKDFETGETCPDAVRFYNEYFDEMIKAGIEPIINLYHFDMPTILQETYGGFENKKVVDLFVLYAKKSFELFGKKIKYWVTFNEPIVPVEGGYLYDFHYPCKKDPKLAVQVGYNTLLAHARATRVYREMKLEGEIGCILNLTPSYPRSTSPEDLKASELADLFFNRSFLDPMVKGEIPEELCNIFSEHSIAPEMSEAELQEIKREKLDFLGVNYYVPRRVQQKESFEKEKFQSPEYYFDYYTNPEGRFNPFRDNNEIYPTALYDIAQNIKENYGNIKWYLSEIGIAMDLKSEETSPDGSIDDSFRTALLTEHLIKLHEAIEDGANCIGVHNWTFIDNWSWLNSFKRRYGFYRLDLETGDRILKNNGKWFAEVAKNNGF